jgi:hypothetical protein
MKAQRALLFLYQRHAPAASSGEGDAIAIVYEPGWNPGPVWTDAENLAPAKFDPQTVHPVASCYTDYVNTKIQDKKR